MELRNGQRAVGYIVAFVAFSHGIGRIGLAYESVGTGLPHQRSPETQCVSEGGSGSERRNWDRHIVWEGRIMVWGCSRGRHFGASSNAGSRGCAHLLTVQGQ